MDKKQKVLIILVIIFVASLFCYFINYRQPSSLDAGPSIDIADWKTYIYEEAGFSIKYPAAWNIMIGRGNELFINFGTGASQKQLQVDVTGEDGGGTIDGIIKTREQDHGKLSYSNITIDGVRAVKFDYGEILLVKDRKTYHFYSIPKDDPVINKMIETLRFN